MKTKKTIGLMMKLLIILVIPLLLFRYVDSQPTNVNVSDAEEKKGTRDIAVVNEDNGIVMSSEEVLLGNEIPILLNEKEEKDYNWTVVQRSTAEQGFNDRTYDAVVYITSDFTERVMSFKEENPDKAKLNYVIQPYLDAKNRQRIHREMANAENIISENMSTIYWNYVSEEIKNIREHFDSILEKEIAFQNAMYSFYAPSSKKMAEEIGQHKKVLESILNQTDNINEVSKGNIDMGMEAEKEMNLFAEALGKYKEAQQTQQQSLHEFLVENKEIIHKGIQLNDQLMKKGIQDLNTALGDHATQNMAYNNAFQSYFGDMRGTVQKSKTNIKQWSTNTDKIFDQQQKHLEDIVVNFSEEYLNRSFAKNLDASTEALDSSINEILEANQEAEFIVPVEPEDGNALSFRELERSFKHLGKEIDRLKRKLEPVDQPIDQPEVPEEPGEPGEPEEPGENPEEKPEDPPVEEPGDETEVQVRNDEGEGQSGEGTTGYEEDWQPLLNQYQLAESELKTLIENYDTEETVANWKNYAADLLKINEDLQRNKDKTKGKLNRKVSDLQRKILNFYKRFNKDEYDRFVLEFEKVNKILEKRSIEHLIDYAESLTEHHVVLEQKLEVDRELIQDIIRSNEKIGDTHYNMMEWYRENKAFEKNIRGILGIPFDIDSEKENQNRVKNFSTLVQDAEKSLEQYSESLEGNKEQMNALLNGLTEEVENVLAGLSKDNAETFEWEESPALQYVDEHVPVNIHNISQSSFEQLAQLVSSLDENQDTMIQSTTELQVKVGDVQKESDDLNNRWEQNVSATKKVHDDVYEVLGNTIVDGQSNPFVYNYLSNPVNVEGKVDGKVMSKKEERIPPVVMLLIILISGLLVGSISNYYSKMNYYAQSGLFIMLNLAIGLIISVYSINLYHLNDAQTIKWTILTLLLLFAISNIVRGGFFIHTFVGWLASIGVIIFSVTPLLNIAVPEFQFNNPIADVYIGLQYNTNTPYLAAVSLLALIVILVSVFVYTYQILTNKHEKVDQDEEISA